MFEDIFKELRSIMKTCSKNLVLVRDEFDDYYLDTHYMMKNKKPLSFGGVKIGKSYVSYHLMPVYVYPELLGNISSELKKRMQGKSCFNFRKKDDVLFMELQTLTKKGFEKYKDAGTI